MPFDLVKMGQEGLRIQVKALEEEGWMPDFMVTRIRKLEMTEGATREVCGEETRWESAREHRNKTQRCRKHG